MTIKNEASIDFFYETYLEIFKEDCKKYEDKIKEIENKISLILTEIKSTCKTVILYDNLKVDDLPKISISSYIKNHGFLYIKIDELRFIEYLKQIRELKVNLKRTKENYSILKKNLVSKKIYKNTIEKAMEISVNRMIYEGKPLCINPNLGVIKVAAKKNKPGTRVIDQGKTREIKNRLLKEGKTLKSKENPNGYPYKVFYTDSVFYRVKWFRVSKFLYKDNIINYRFKTTKGDNNIMSKLYKFIRTFPEKTLIYAT